VSEQTMPDVNAVYRERDQLVAALSKLFPSWLGPVDDAEPGWTGAIYIQLPTGQVSWHIPDEEAATLFAHVPADASRRWDGHTTPEKYARLNALADHVSAPESMIRDAADSLQKIASGSITGNNQAHRLWAQKRADALRALLPERGDE